MNLLEVPVGDCARLMNVDASVLKKLKTYGLHIGDNLQLMRIAPMGGPLLVSVNGREIALGRAVAKKIFVEVECASP